MAKVFPVPYFAIVLIDLFDLGTIGSTDSRIAVSKGNQDNQFPR